MRLNQFLTLTQLHLILLIISNVITISEANKRDIIIKNKSSNSIRVYWINEDEDEDEDANDKLVEQIQNIDPNSKDGLLSYVGHAFLIEESYNNDAINCIPGKDIDEDGFDQQPLQTVIRVKDGEKQEFIVLDGLDIQYVDSKTKATDQADELIKECYSEISANNNNIIDQNIFDDDDEIIISCLETKVVNILWKTHYEETIFQSTLTKNIREETYNYVCNDTKLKTSLSIEESFWASDTDDENIFHVNTLFDDHNTQVQIINDFITPADCDDIFQRSLDFNNIKSTISIPIRDDDDDDDVIENMIQQIYEFSSDQTHFDISIEEEGDKNDLLLFNKTRNHFSVDPYCDNNDGEDTCNDINDYDNPSLQQQQNYDEGKSSRRVATMILFCNVADGYSINFNNAGVYIVPTAGMAVFSTASLSTTTNDFGYTEYTECSPIRDDSEIIGIKHSFRLDG